MPHSYDRHTGNHRKTKAYRFVKTVTNNPIIKSVGKIISGKIQSDLLPGENHGILQLPDGSFARGQYLGPGTNVITRLKRGDLGRTPVDQISKIHDIRYSLATNPQDVRNADNEMIQAIDRVRKNGKDKTLNITQANLIKAKKWFDGTFHQNSFADMKGPRSVEDKLLLINALQNARKW